jgi:hypothetical protein
MDVGTAPEIPSRRKRESARAFGSPTGRPFIWHLAVRWTFGRIAPKAMGLLPLIPQIPSMR